MKWLDPKLDLVFKLLLTREPELLRDMLACILARPIRGFEILDAYVILFSDQLSFHVLQLRAAAGLSPSRSSGYDVQVERWARFFMARDEGELEQLAAEDPIMSLAKDTLEQLSKDPVVQRRARDRAHAVELNRMDLLATRLEAEAKGRAEGRSEGRAEALLKLLGLRFGAPSAVTRLRVESASPEQLDLWIERVLSAQTLDDVLAP